MPEEAAKQLGQANMLYAKGQYKEAAELLMEVIKVGKVKSANKSANRLAPHACFCSCCPGCVAPTQLHVHIWRRRDAPRANMCIPGHM